MACEYDVDRDNFISALFDAWEEIADEQKQNDLQMTDERA